MRGLAFFVPSQPAGCGTHADPRRPRAAPAHRGPRQRPASPRGPPGDPRTSGGEEGGPASGRGRRHGSPVGGHRRRRGEGGRPRAEPAEGRVRPEPPPPGGVPRGFRGTDALPGRLVRLRDGHALVSPHGGPGARPPRGAPRPRSVREVPHPGVPPCGRTGGTCPTLVRAAARRPPPLL